MAIYKSGNRVFERGMILSLIKHVDLSAIIGLLRIYLVVKIYKSSYYVLLIKGVD